MVLREVPPFPASDIRDFVAVMLDILPRNAKVAHAEPIAVWTVEIDYGSRSSVANTTTYGTLRASA